MALNLLPPRYLLGSHEPGHTPSGLGCRLLRSDLTGDDPQRCGLANSWEQSTFTG